MAREKCYMLSLTKDYEEIVPHLTTFIVKDVDGKIVGWDKHKIFLEGDGFNITLSLSKASSVDIRVCSPLPAKAFELLLNILQRVVDYKVPESVLLTAISPRQAPDAEVP